MGTGPCTACQNAACDDSEEKRRVPAGASGSRNDFERTRHFIVCMREDVALPHVTSEKALEGQNDPGHHPRIALHITHGLISSRFTTIRPFDIYWRVAIPANG